MMNPALLFDDHCSFGPRRAPQLTAQFQLTTLSQNLITMLTSLQEEKLKDKFETCDMEEITNAVHITLDRLDNNQLAEQH